MTKITLLLEVCTQWLSSPDRAMWIWFALAVLAGMLIMLNLMMGTLVGALSCMFSLTVFWRLALQYASKQNSN